MEVLLRTFLYQRSNEGLPQAALQCKKILDFVKSANQQQEEINKQIEYSLEWRSGFEKLNKIFENLNYLIDKSAPLAMDETLFGHQYVVDFSIAHNGLTFLSLTNDDKRSPCKIASYTAVRQAFNYLKYSVHTHKHHINEKDSVTRVIEITNQSDISYLWIR